MFNALWLYYIGGWQQIESVAQGINCRHSRCLNTSCLLWFVLWGAVPLMKNNLSEKKKKDFLIWTMPVGACWLRRVMMESFQLNWWLWILLSHSSSLFPSELLFIYPVSFPLGEKNMGLLHIVMCIPSYSQSLLPNLFLPKWLKMHGAHQQLSWGKEGNGFTNWC